MECGQHHPSFPLGRGMMGKKRPKGNEGRDWRGKVGFDSGWAGKEGLSGSDDKSTHRKGGGEGLGKKEECKKRSGSCGSSRKWQSGGTKPWDNWGVI